MAPKPKGDATFAAPVGTRWDQAGYTNWFWVWLNLTLLNCTTGSGAGLHASFVIVNSHLTQEHWRGLSERRWPPAGIPLFAPHTPNQKGYITIQTTDEAGNRHCRKLHRLACATIDNRLRLFLEDPSLWASYRLITFPGSARDFNANNLVPENGIMSNSRSFCKYKYFKYIKLDRANDYAAAMLTPGASALGALEDEEGPWEALKTAYERVTFADHTAAYAEMHKSCVKVHGQECLVYFAQDADFRISSKVLMDTQKPLSRLSRAISRVS